MNKVKIFFFLFFPLFSIGQINLTSIGNTYTETFGTGSINTWTNNSTFPGWYLAAGGTMNFEPTITITTSAPPNNGGFYTYRCNGTTDIKLGTRPSNGSGGTAGTGVSYMGMRLKNTTGVTITNISISFDAFQLSKAENDCNPNSLTFSYRVGTNLTSLTTGTWTNVNALDYLAPNNDCSGGTSSQLVGYPCTVSSNLSTCLAVNIPNNSEIVLRWGDINNQANDPHLAIDNISVTPLQTVSITAGGPTTFCQGQSVVLTASGSNSFTWQPGGATTSSITVSTAGTYTVSGSATACPSQQSTQTVIVDPAPTISGTAVITPSSCGSSNGSISGLSASGSGTITYTWTNASMTQVSISTVSADLTNQPAGIYTLVVSSSSNTCSSTAGPFSIGNSGALPAPTVNNNPPPVCEGTTLNLSSSGTGTSYNWTGPNSFSSTQQNPTVSLNATTAMSGDYYVTQTLAGCTSLPGIVHIDVDPLPSAIITPSGSTTFCAGNSVTLNGSGVGTSFYWMPGNITSTSITPTVSGTYTYYATSTCGVDSAFVSVTVESVTALFTNNVFTGIYPLTVNFINNSSANATSYSWNFGDGNTSLSTSASNTFQTPGTYTTTLTVANLNGCSDSYSVTIVVLEQASFLEMPNVFTPNGDSKNDTFTAISSGLGEFDCSIFDRWGIKINEIKTSKDGWDGRTMAGIAVNDGTYFYIVKAKGLDEKEYNLQGFVQLIRK